MKRLWLIATVMLSANSLILGKTCPTGSFPAGCVDSNGIHGQVLDTGGQVFNVKAYGATGNGTTNDTAAVNAAISAAQVNGGVLYFPPGVYDLNNPNQVNPSHMVSGHAVVSIRCASPTSTTIQFTGSRGFVLSNVLRITPYYAGDVTGCDFDLTKASSTAIALHAVDSAGWMIHNNAFTGVAADAQVGIEFENSIAWSERNQVISSQFYELKDGIAFIQDASSTYFSFGYTVISWDHFQIPAGGSGIVVNGNGHTTGLYNSFIDARANFDSTSGQILDAVNKARVYNSSITLAGEGSTGTYLMATDSGGAVIAVSAPVFSLGGQTTFYTGTHISIVIASGGFDFWQQGSGAPSGACNSGSLYSNASGSAGSTLYACVSGAWVDVR